MEDQIYVYGHVCLEYVCLQDYMVVLSITHLDIVMGKQFKLIFLIAFNENQC